MFVLSTQILYFKRKMYIHIHTVYETIKIAYKMYYKNLGLSTDT